LSEYRQNISADWNKSVAILLRSWQAPYLIIFVIFSFVLCMEMWVSLQKISGCHKSEI